MFSAVFVFGVLFIYIYFYLLFIYFLPTNGGDYIPQIRKRKKNNLSIEKERTSVFVLFGSFCCSNVML